MNAIEPHKRNNVSGMKPRDIFKSHHDSANMLSEYNVSQVAFARIIYAAILADMGNVISDYFVDRLREWPKKTTH